MSMVVSICHTSVLTWTIAATLKLLSTRVEEQRDPENRPDSLERKIIVFRNRSSQPSPRPECSTKVRVRKRPSTKASRKLLQFYDETYPLLFVLLPLRYRTRAWTILGNGSSVFVFIKLDDVNTVNIESR